MLQLQSSPDDVIPAFPEQWPSGRLDPAHEPAHQQILAAIQAGILRDHGRDHGLLIFFRLPEASREDNRRVIRAAGTLVTSALHQAATNKIAQPNTIVTTLALTATAFEKCGAAQPIDPNGAEDVFFSEGMGGESTARHLLDPPQEDLDEPFRSLTARIDGVWLLAGNPGKEFEGAISQLDGWFAEFEVERVGEPQCCGRWRPGEWVDGEKPPAREPFGFRDGLSDPRFFHHEPANHFSVDIPVSQIVVTEPGEHRGGAFLVVRKLEQNVKAFREFEANLDRALHEAAGPGGDQDLRRLQKTGMLSAAPLLIGRDREGRPQVPHYDPGMKPNKFQFSHDPGARTCPFDAHIRKANPRFKDDRAGGINAIPAQKQRDAQFVRRSMVYGIDQLTMEGPWPEKGVGLWFMGYMRDFETQFKVMHEWLTATVTPVQSTGGTPRFSDLMLFGGRDVSQRPLPTVTDFRWQGAQWCGFSTFVTFKGGEFFFAPSRIWFDRL